MTRISEYVIKVDDNDLQETVRNIGAFSVRAVALKHEIEELEKEMTKLATDAKRGTGEYQLLSKALGQLTTAQHLNNEALRAATDGLKAHSKEAVGSAGSYASMKIQAKELTENLQKLDLSTEEGKAQFKTYREQLQQVTAELAYLDAAMLSTTTEGDQFSMKFGAAFNKVENHVKAAGSTFKDLKGAVELMGIEGLTSAMDGATKAIEKAGMAYKGFQAVMKLGNSIIDTYKTITNSITSAKEAYKAGVSAATIIQIALNVAVKSNPLGLIVGLVASAAAAFASYKLGADDATESQEDFNEALREAQELLENSTDIATLVGIVDKLDADQVEALRNRIQQELKIIENKLLDAKALNKKINELQTDLQKMAQEDIKNPSVSLPSESWNSKPVDRDKPEKNKPDPEFDRSLKEQHLRDKQNELEKLGVYELTLAYENHQLSLNKTNEAKKNLEKNEKSLPVQIGEHKKQINELIAEREKLNVGSKEYQDVTNNIIKIENSLFKLEERRKNADSHTTNSIKKVNEETSSYANTINGLSQKMGTLIQAQQNLDLSTEDGRQVFAKYAEEIEKVNEELEKQQSLAENLALASKPASINPVEGTLSTQDPTAGMKTVEMPEGELEKKTGRIEEIKAKAQEAADAFGKITNALDIVDQISEAHLQNELARIEEKRDAEIAAVNASVLSEEEKKRQIDSINERYDKQTETKQKAAAKRDKAIAITKTIIAGAQAVAQGIAQFGPPPSPAGIAAIAAAAVTTGTQLALIAKQKFAQGGYIPFETGGMIQGALHSQGGVQFLSGGSTMEAEGGELIVNRNIWRRPDFVKNISEMNALTGGKRFFAAGGMVPTVSPPAYVSTTTMPAEGFDNEILVRGLRGVIAEEVGSLRIVNNVVDTTSQQQRLLNIQTGASF
ncbi:hypothetical protein BH09BAC1_BH09BAC1_16330 [soil metagenome]